MAKSKTLQRHIFKIQSKRLRRANWDIKLTVSEAFENDELISIADSQAIRFIYDIKGINMQDQDSDVKNLKRKIKSIKREKTSSENKKEIKKLYKELHEKLFLPEYVTVKFDTVKDFDRACRGFFINNIEYKRIVGTTGGVKTKTIVFVKTGIHEQLNKMIRNGANDIELIPAKLEAYRALAFSSSIPVKNTKNIVVVKDWETKFKSDIIQVGDDSDGLYVKNIKNADMSLEDSDGYGAISPKLSKEWSDSLGEDYIPSGYVIRNSFCKGCLFTFDIKDFSEKIANKDSIIDVWGNVHNVDDVDIIMPVSMLKLWKAYDSIEHYIESCDKNGYIFSITKMIPKKLENYRDLNYQFLQSLKINDEDLYKLLKPTIDEIHDILGGDYRKTLLFLRGTEMNEDTAWMNNDYNYIQAMMIDKRMNDDPFVRSHVHRMIKKRIQDAKTGVIRTQGCFQIASGDIFGFMEFAFGMDNPKGLLKSNEFYSNYWSEKGINKIAGFRAPMTCHENIKIMNLKHTEDMLYWYKYMNNVLIFNAWDCSAHTLNGLDKDGDQVFSTCSEVILNGIIESDPIVCMQSSALKVIPSDKDLQNSNKNGFGEKIGTYTNRATAMEQMKVKFDKNSQEHKELDRRIKLCMHFQQNEIDKIKGIKSPPMPKEWYDYKINKIEDEDSDEIISVKEFNLKILANKKPKFMIYIYSDLMRDYKDFIKSAKNNCLMRFKMTPDELRMKVDKSQDESDFLIRMDIQNPVEECNSLMNKVCSIIEMEFDGVVKERNKAIDFDYSFLVPNVKVSSSRSKKIEQYYKEYSSRVKNFMSEKNNFDDEDESEDRRVSMISWFESQCYSTCTDENELLAILMKLMYKTNKSKQFLWDMCGRLIIKNLLEDNNYNISFPVRDNRGELKYSFEKYKMKTINVEEVFNGDN